MKLKLANRFGNSGMYWQNIGAYKFVECMDWAKGNAIDKNNQRTDDYRIEIGQEPI